MPPKIRGWTPFFYYYHFRAYFLDEDDVEIVRIDLQQRPNFALKGQKLRFTLQIPKDKNIIRNTIKS